VNTNSYFFAFFFKNPKDPFAEIDYFFDRLKKNNSENQKRPTTFIETTNSLPITKNKTDKTDKNRKDGL
jgi:hypothetical protein